MGAVSGDAKNIRPLLDDIRADLETLRTAFLALTAKLDLDVGVTDANYASTLNPSANKTVE